MTAAHNRLERLSLSSFLGYSNLFECGWKPYCRVKLLKVLYASKIKLEKNINSDKHSSLLCVTASDEELKRLMTLTPGYSLQSFLVLLKKSYKAKNVYLFFFFLVTT